MAQHKAANKNGTASGTAVTGPSSGFTAEERADMKERARELKVG